MRLALGTVQFGAPYGVSNSSGLVPFDDVIQILTYAKSKGVDTLDTAISYGQSEDVLGKIGIQQWKIITKIPSLNESVGNIESWLNEHIDSSMLRLGVRRLEGVLLHRPEDILSDAGDLYVKALESLRETGKVSKIGYSIYSPDSLEQLTARFWPDIVQVPYNVFDQRIISSGWLDVLTSRNTKVHSRSIFLLGLLVMPNDSRPAYFSKWSSLLSKWDEFVAKAGQDPVHLALNFALQEKRFDRIIVGVDSLMQLKHIMDERHKAVSVDLMMMSSYDKDLIEPSRWVLD
jgi:aryl-alcohol dehydrogenase-like predicted oxidoreductase